MTVFIVFVLKLPAQPFCFTPPPGETCQCVEFSLEVVLSGTNGVFDINITGKDISTNPPAGPSMNGEAATVTAMDLYMFFNTTQVMATGWAMAACFTGSGWNTANAQVLSNGTGFFTEFDSYFRLPANDINEIGCLMDPNGSTIITINFSAVTSGTAEFLLAQTDPAAFGSPTYSTVWAPGVNSVCTGVGMVSVMSVLPLRLLSFNVKNQSDANMLLTWATADEVDFSHFEIERSMDGMNWTDVGSVTSTLTNEYANHYQYLDDLPLLKRVPQVYYRLKMVDLDGSFTYSPVEAVALHRNDNTLQVFPNPARSDFRISWTGEATELSLLDITGRVIYDRDVRGLHQIEISSGNMNIPSGMYVLDLSNGPTSLGKERLVLLGNQ